MLNEIIENKEMESSVLESIDKLDDEFLDYIRDNLKKIQRRKLEIKQEKEFRDVRRRRIM